MISFLESTKAAYPSVVEKDVGANNSGDEHEENNPIPVETRDERERHFREVLKAKGLTVKEVKSDGACLFRSDSPFVHICRLYLKSHAVRHGIQLRWKFHIIIHANNDQKYMYRQLSWDFWYHLGLMHGAELHI